MKKVINSIHTALSSVCLIDKFLMVFMLLLLLQSTHVLFSGHFGEGESNTIDIAVRTSAAAIFGYFLSGNFAGQKSSVSAIAPKVKTSASDSVKNSIGFSSSSEADAGFSDAHYSNHCARVQTVIISSIGIISLVILILTREQTGLSAHASPIISQLRDFVSAAIGYLISCGKEKAV